MIFRFALMLLPVVLLAQPDRIAGRIDRGHTVALQGNVHPNARTEFDQGPADPAMKLNYVTLTLKLSASQQAELDQLLLDQQNSLSPKFRKWLTPEEYADRFGASPADMSKIVDWLESEGFEIIGAARGRRWVAFNATAGQIQTALHTEIHRYNVNGEQHFANSTEPTVPAAIAPFTIGFGGLDDFKLRPSPQKVKPDLNYQGQNVLAPGDLWIIYDILPLFSNAVGVTGTGLKLAVAGQSDVSLSDITTYRNDFNLPTNPPVKMLVQGATNPGIVTGDSGESDLDLEMTGAVAPNAQIIFVYSSNVTNSAMYAIDQAVAPVLSYSYAGCEANQSASLIAAIEPLAQQANAQGITWIAASGDLGAAACDVGNAISKDGIAVMVPASVPEVTGVGGTTLEEGFGTTFWSQTNGPYYGNSALSYIPEVGWNDSNSSHIGASGGGMSTIYARPAWQNAPGVTGGSARLVPDVAMAASANHDGYFTFASGGIQISGGTSAATPVFAGIVLLMNQYLGANGLGNINPNLYKLASSTTSVFHDVTTGSNFVSCVAGVKGCIGGQLGYSAGAGYDMVTGLGSVDAYNMMQLWPASQPAIAHIFNAASFVDTGLSPGLIFSVSGSGLGPSVGKTLAIDTTGKISTNLGGVQVLVNNTPAPLLYVSATQINAVAPYEIANQVGQRVNVQVIANGVAGPSVSDLVVSTAPAMFNLGNNQAAVINQDGTVNGPNNPAARGAYISIYATGEGQTSPGGIDGSVSGLSKPIAGASVSIGQINAAVLYAGTASFDGFFQVNAVIPQSLTPGSVPITLTVGAAASPTLNVYVK
ncbi:MAG TPA: protease pro-enzyme activation domain-containing protein [Bryobacteraceae bacterium]|jgi:uncharacterized protein (TIGR03437 family)|nr:protease pro-enzyme activation domain-containing protein [Bryobacteraceae bacterium]